jgi:hypothetical protein
VTYSSFPDEYTRLSCWDGVGYESRWHYHALVEECSRSQRYDGVLPRNLALRVSDVPDPNHCIDELGATPLLDAFDNAVRIVHMETYLPPEGQRDENLLPRKRQNQQAYRRRKCENGEHSRDCPAETCPVKLAALPGALPSALPVTHNHVGGNGVAASGVAGELTHTPPATLPPALPVTPGLDWTGTTQLREREPETLRISDLDAYLDALVADPPLEEGAA